MLTVTLTNLFVCVRLFYVRVQCCQRLGLGGSYTAWTARCEIGERFNSY